jgi:hypothetical protein
MRVEGELRRQCVYLSVNGCSLALTANVCSRRVVDYFRGDWRGLVGRIGRTQRLPFWMLLNVGGNCACASKGEVYV